MILRLAASAAVHTAGGVVMGVTAVLAACTVAQVAKVAVDEVSKPRRPGPPARSPEPAGVRPSST